MSTAKICEVPLTALSPSQHHPMWRGNSTVTPGRGGERTRVKSGAMKNSSREKLFSTLNPHPEKCEGHKQQGL